MFTLLQAGKYLHPDGKVLPAYPESVSLITDKGRLNIFTEPRILVCKGEKYEGYLLVAHYLDSSGKVSSDAVKTTEEVAAQLSRMPGVRILQAMKIEGSFELKIIAGKPTEMKFPYGTSLNNLHDYFN